MAHANSAPRFDISYFPVITTTQYRVDTIRLPKTIVCTSFPDYTEEEFVTIGAECQETDAVFTITVLPRRRKFVGGDKTKTLLFWT